MNPIDSVIRERRRQTSIWGVQNHDPSKWLAILVEEVGEVAQEINDMDTLYHGSEERYRTELIQVAAVAVAAIESIERTYEENV